MDFEAQLSHGIHHWSVELPGAHLLFSGKGSTTASETFAALQGADHQVGWSRQVHGTRIVEGRAGDCGEADALRTERRDLAISVQTADCVPVVILEADRLHVVHAGWKGLRDGILTAALVGAAEGAVAVIGPHIGRCCYEVGDDLARAMAQAIDAAIVLRREPRPHLDLGLAAEIQLSKAGAHVAGHLEECTRCHPESLWSYRRDGARAGRNFTFAWFD